jgi:hypothetical protein
MRKGRRRALDPWMSSDVIRNEVGRILGTMLVPADVIHRLKPR